MSQPAASASALDTQGASPPLMLSQMIDQLSPVPEPVAVAWWPQTWGWLVLAVVVLALLSWLGWRRYRHWKSNRYRREALAELHRRLAGGEGATALAEVLRRTALAAFPRERIVSLRGEAWERFLNQTVAPGKPCFDAASVARLTELPYRQTDAADRHLDDLTWRVERWISVHDSQRGRA
ncbi:DUF4381 domain-containing protein [Salinicola sp. CPA57]|uniref:DUF4381 domain-containing protein n=1 Tax=Salinicola sp. CPA57 TaxID=1949080 RepID=UPI000DA1C89F|nr:DUF4381 domain-containing protein [Salinicola sp. CPA57]